MSIDIERELRLAMQDATAHLVAAPDLLTRRPQVRRTPRWRLAAAVAAVAVLTATAAVVAARLGGGRAGVVSPAAVFGGWGPTRGDLAGDDAYLAAVAREWAHPHGRDQGISGFDPVEGADQPLQVLWAGTTPDGPAAVAVQHTRSTSLPYWFGVFVPGPDGAPRLYHRTQYDDQTPDDFGQDPRVFAFSPSAADDAVVVLPTDPGAALRISYAHRTAVDGGVSRSWSDVVAVGGAAVLSLPPGTSPWDTVVQVTQDGVVAATRPLDVIPSPHPLQTTPPPPAGALGLWCNACNVTGGGDLGYSSAMLRAWVTRHAPAYEPMRTGEWSIGGDFPGGWQALAMQMWFYGDAPHTVALWSRGGGDVRVLTDDVTDPRARPLVSVRLPDGNGWLVGAGPAARITGWRLSAADAWTDIASRPAALLPTDAGALQLRLLVKGHERVVDETAP